MKPQYWLAAAALLTVVPARADVGKIAFTSTRDGNQEIYSMNPDGSAQTRLTNTPNNIEEFPAWSLDGSKIAYNRSNEIWTMNADGTNPTSVITGNGGERRDPEFKPNSNLLSYSRYDGNWETNTIEPTGANETLLFNHPLGPYDAQWSPDGSKICFHSFDNFGSYPPRLYLCNADGSGIVALTDAGNRNASWSPDGSHIAFQSSRNGPWQIYVMNADGSNQTRITNTTTDETEPVYSPDGSKFVFVSDRTGTNQIFVMNADGSGQTRLTTDGANDVSVIWGQTMPANAPSVSISDATVAEGNSGTTNATFTISLSAASTAPVTVTYQTYDGTATTGSDYVAVPPTSVVFAVGQTTKTITVAVKGDTLDETNETFSVRLSALGAQIGDQVGVGTITNDDTPPTISINDIGVMEGDSGTVNAIFKVSLSGVSGSPVTVSYATSDGTAFNTGLGTSSGDYNGGDYFAKAGTVTIPAGQTTATIPITVLGDTIIEYNETFFVNLSNPVNATIADNQGRGLIVNDDTKPGLIISDATVAEGGTATFNLTMSHAFTSPVTITYATADGTAVAGSDYTAKSGTVVIPALQTKATITVSTINDTVLENNETFLVNITAPDLVVTDAQGVGTITSEDLPQLYVSDVSMLEGKSGQRAMYFTVALSEPAPFAVTANYATSDGVAVAGEDYVSTSGLISFAPGELSKSIAVPIKGDTTYESDEVFYLNLSGATKATISVASGKGTIVNDDDQPTGAPQIKAGPSIDQG